MALAFDPETKHKSLARRFEVHPKTAVRVVVSTAATYMQCQLAWLRNATSLCIETKPAAIATSRKWDETKAGPNILETQAHLYRSEQDFGPMISNRRILDRTCYLGLFVFVRLLGLASSTSW